MNESATEFLKARYRNFFYDVYDGLLLATEVDDLTGTPCGFAQIWLSVRNCKFGVWF